MGAGSMRERGPGIKMMERKLKLSVLIPSFSSWYSLQRHHRTLIADGHPLESDTFFHVHWNCGRIILQSSSGRFLGIAPNGLLMANATIPGELSIPLARLSKIRDVFRENWNVIFKKALEALESRVRSFESAYRPGHRIIVARANHLLELHYEGVIHSVASQGGCDD
jgi:hypothetical protein